MELQNHEIILLNTISKGPDKRYGCYFGLNLDILLFRFDSVNYLFIKFGNNKQTTINRFCVELERMVRINNLDELRGFLFIYAFQNIFSFDILRNSINFAIKSFQLRGRIPYGNFYKNIESEKDIHILYRNKNSVSKDHIKTIKKVLYYYQGYDGISYEIK